MSPSQPRNDELEDARDEGQESEQHCQKQAEHGHRQCVPLRCVSLHPGHDRVDRRRVLDNAVQLCQARTPVYKAEIMGYWPDELYPRRIRVEFLVSDQPAERRDRAFVAHVNQRKQDTVDGDKSLEEQSGREGSPETRLGDKQASRTHNDLTTGAR